MAGNQTTNNTFAFLMFRLLFKKRIYWKLADCCWMWGRSLATFYRLDGALERDDDSRTGKRCQPLRAPEIAMGLLTRIWDDEILERGETRRDGD
jgi:hypothetical protein